MKTKTLAISLMLTFTTGALFAQSKTDTIPQRKDTTQKKDTVSSANAAIGIKTRSNVATISKINSGCTDPMKNQTVYVTLTQKGKL